MTIDVTFPSEQQLGSSPNLFDIGIVDGCETEAYDRFTRLTTLTIDVPISLISIVQEEKDRQFFTSQIGLPAVWAEKRQIPLSHSFCRLVKRDNCPLIVEDASDDTRVRENLAIPDLGVRAYLGVPIHDALNDPIGALCAVQSSPRSWTPADIEILLSYAACVDEQTRLQTALLVHTMSC
ncbi:GAF domain-containing protein [Rhodobacteraceae bacterium D3-12]|nr:GAF domain-containing protein [Rhodobacteraceae bacterium D3-12]